MHWRLHRTRNIIKPKLLLALDFLRNFIFRKFHLSDTKRWINEESLKAGWEERNAIIASHISKGASVIDLGCGKMTLRKFLAPECTYQPVDIVKRSPDCIVCNFNKKQLPQRAKYDYVVCSGLLEYIHDLPSFISGIQSYANTFIITYSTMEYFPSKSLRARNGWVNTLTDEDIISLITKTGAQISHKETIYSNQTLYVFTQQGISLNTCKPL